MLQGCHGYFMGADWIWNRFDFFCICMGLFDLGVTYYLKYFGEGGAKLDGILLLKMLRLGRLTRLVRLLRFKIFHELKMMLQGVFSGGRVLFWAVVLLFVVIYLLGIIMRKLVGDSSSQQFPEF